MKLKMAFWSDEALLNFWKKRVFSSMGSKPKGETSRINGRKHKAKPKKRVKQLEMFEK